MNPHEIHHIKAYIVFSAVSILSVGLLIYLYLPIGIGQNLFSSTLGTQVPQTTQTPEPTEWAISENATNNEVSGRRMRLTQILIRTQKELKTLEDQRKSSPQWLDTASEQKIVKLREKIANIEKMITEIK